MKIVIGYNTAHYVWLFRVNLIKELIQNGHEIIVASPTDQYVEKIKMLGVKHINVPMVMNKNPLTDFLILVNFIILFLKHRPKLYLGYTVKPNVYGSLAAHLLNIPAVNNIAGLGSSFVANGISTKIVRQLYKLALNKSRMVFFQNNDDKDMFVGESLIKHNRYHVLPGSGVDLNRYNIKNYPRQNESSYFTFLLVARMLWDKGVREYVEAATIAKSHNPKLKFQLLGSLDVDNPAAIPRKTIINWHESGVVEYLGVSDDPGLEMSKVQCVVLPSYREGTPRSLLEAASMSLPLITTNAVGCKEVVDDGINGYLCKVKDSVDLAHVMLKISKLPKLELHTMGVKSREKVEIQFDEKNVIERYMEVVNSI